jgi:hypothetical protein
MGIELEVNMTPRVNLKKGIYTAKVEKVEERTTVMKETGETIKYIDIFFAVNGRKDGAFPKEAMGQILKFGAPSKISAGSKLAGLLVQAGVTPVTGQKLDVQAAFIGKTAELVVTPEKWTGKDGRDMESPRIKDVEFISA